jgi:hypothetical protein
MICNADIATHHTQHTENMEKQRKNIFLLILYTLYEISSSVDIMLRNFFVDHSGPYVPLLRPSYSGFVAATGRKIS